MKRPAPAIALLLLLTSLPACHTRRTAETVQQGSTITAIDTTHRVSDALEMVDTTLTTDSISARHSIATDTTAASAIVEFIPGGGWLSVDTAGTVTLRGVAPIRHSLSAATRHELTATATHGIEHRGHSATAIHNEQRAGLSTDSTFTTQTEKETTPARRWYETALIRLGLGVLIAALLYLLFLYLRRKR